MKKILSSICFAVAIVSAVCIVLTWADILIYKGEGRELGILNLTCILGVLGSRIA